MWDMTRVILPDLGDITNSESPERDKTLDALKGLAIVLVLVLHVVPLTYVPRPGGAIHWPEAALHLSSTLFYMYVCRLAVPIFFVVSLLLVVESARPTVLLARRRLVRLFELLMFWATVYWLAGWPQSAPAGGSLPVYLGTLYRNGSLYFLVDLTVLTVIIILLRLIRSKLTGHALDAIAIVGLGLSVAYLGYLQVTAAALPFWQVLNFVPYVFGACIVRRREWIAPLLVSGGIALSLEVLLTSSSSTTLWEGLQAAGYSRPSVVFGALAAVAIALSRGASVTWPSWTATLGRHSLGIYLVHPLFVRPAHEYLGWHAIDMGGGEWIMRPEVLLAVVASTALVILLMRSTPLRRYFC